eukprot:4956370-Ditylum_brightwellii.AAC.1
MSSSSGMSARITFISAVLPNTLPSQSIKFCSQLAYYLACGFHLLGVSVYTLSDVFTSSIGGLDVGKYENVSHEPKGILNPSPGKLMAWSFTVGFTLWILGVSFTLIPASLSTKG